jgi:hypothetical protein
MPEPAPSRPDADRNLLFGILALQMDFVTRDALVKAMNAWVLDKHKPLGQILVEQGALREDTRAALEVVVGKHLELHGGDPQHSLASVSSLRSLRQDLEQVADPDQQASLAQVSVARHAGPDPDLTSDYSAGTPTSIPVRCCPLLLSAVVVDPRGGGADDLVGRNEWAGGVEDRVLASGVAEAVVSLGVAVVADDLAVVADAAQGGSGRALGSVDGREAVVGRVVVVGQTRRGCGRTGYGAVFQHFQSRSNSSDRLHDRSPWLRHSPVQLDSPSAA